MTLQEGDIFRWSYKEPTDERLHNRYWCCSGIAVVIKNRLFDTYWSMPSDGRSFGPEEIWRLDLVRLGNFSELVKAQEYQADYYDDADIVNLNHSNSSKGNFYLRKGAVRSATKMLEVTEGELERSISAERSAARRSEQLRETIARIKDGETDLYL